MDASRFDRLIRAFAAPASRRVVLAALGVKITSVPNAVRAKQRKKKVKRNAFGCVNVGGFCKNDGQCCSGRCQGKKGKKRCQAHDGGSCQAGDDSCEGGGSGISCTTDDGHPGFCVITTGRAAYCASTGNCFVCTKDADCVPFCGVRAACIVCTNCPETGSTACDATGTAQCDF